MSNLNMITEHRILRATIFTILHIYAKITYFCIFIQFCIFTTVNIRFVNNLTTAAKYHYFTYTFQS